MFEGLKSAKDVVLLASAANAVDKEYDGRNDTYNRTALDIASRVEKGALDPLAGEAALSDASRYSDYTRSTTSPAVEKASRPLERLVEKGLIDPMVAEDLMDINFSRYAVADAIDKMRRK